MVNNFVDMRKQLISGEGLELVLYGPGILQELMAADTLKELSKSL